MLHDPGKITKTDIDELYAFVLDVAQKLLGIGEQLILLRAGAYGGMLER
jgi:hypothetical protein